VKTKFEAIMADVIKGKLDTSDVKEFLLRNNLYGKAIAQKKYDGNMAEILKDKDEIKLYSEDGKLVDNERIPLLLKAIKEIPVSSFSVSCEIEIWKNGKHLNREDVTGYLHSKGQAVDEGLVANIFDIVYFDGGDLHNLEANDRIEYLKKLNIKQSTIQVPESSLNLAPTYSLTENNVDSVLSELASAPASEGAMIKWGKHSLTGHGTILKWKKYEELKVIVLARNKTKVPTIFNYEIGVGFKNENINGNEIVEIPPKKYLRIGRTYNTDVVCKTGDIISIRFHTLNLYEGKDGVRLHTYEPVFSEKLPEENEPDYFDSIVAKAKLSGLLVTKTEKLIEDLETYNPASIFDTKVLRDDYRLLLGWLSSKIKKYDETLMKEKLKDIVIELFKRQDTLLRPDEYKPKAKRIIMEVLKDLVKKGVFLVEPHSKLITTGEKKLIIKARKYENLLNIPLWLTSKGKVYGIVVLK
jgi:hypothetical protein